MLPATMYRNLPNILSFARLCMAPLVFFLPEQSLFPLFFCAALTDVLDGYLARKFQCYSTLGAVLDPVADKVFAIFCGYRFFSEGAISSYQLFALFSRDVALLFFVVYLLFSKKWKTWVIQSFICGKVATSLQMFVFSLLALRLPAPSFLFYGLFAVAFLALYELRHRARGFIS